MTIQAQVFNMKGEVVGAAELPEVVFGLKPRADLLHEAVTARLANKRSWTAHTKTRAEVSGGGKKPWKQKHTGRARAGSNRSPLWRKGGVTFGPRFVDPVFKRIGLPRRKARVALAQALSARAAQGALAVLDALTLEAAKTRQVVAMLSALGAGPRPLVVIEATDRNLTLASRNVPGLTVALASDLNAYDVLAATRLIVTRAALEKVRSRWS